MKRKKPRKKTVARLTAVNKLKRSGRIIVAFDGRDTGGTVKAIRMAHAQNVPIREIPMGL